MRRWARAAGSGYASSPDRRPLDLESIVWRNDSDGPVFVFLNMPAEDFERLKSLVDNHRSS